MAAAAPDCCLPAAAVTVLRPPVPVLPHLLGVREGGARAPWFAPRLLAGGQAHRPLRAVAPRRAGPRPPQGMRNGSVTSSPRHFITVRRRGRSAPSGTRLPES